MSSDGRLDPISLSDSQKLGGCVVPAAGHAASGTRKEPCTGPESFEAAELHVQVSPSIRTFAMRLATSAFDAGFG